MFVSVRSLKHNTKTKYEDISKLSAIVSKSASSKAKWVVTSEPSGYWHLGEGVIRKIFMQTRALWKQTMKLLTQGHSQNTHPTNIKVCTQYVCLCVTNVSVLTCLLHSPIAYAPGGFVPHCVSLCEWQTFHLHTRQQQHFIQQCTMQ